jgi:hypothetical protein
MASAIWAQPRRLVPHFVRHLALRFEKPSRIIRWQKRCNRKRSSFYGNLSTAGSFRTTAQLRGTAETHTATSNLISGIAIPQRKYIWNQFATYLIDEMRDLYDAEKQSGQALPKVVKASSNSELSEAFEKHLDQTRGHAQRMERAFELLGEKPKSMRGHAGINL